jgi:hypothetical protein
MTKEFKIVKTIFESKDVNNAVRDYIKINLNNPVLRTDMFLLLINKIKKPDIFDYKHDDIRLIKDTRIDRHDDDGDPIYKSVNVNFSIDYLDDDPLIVIHRTVLNHFINFYEIDDDCTNYSESIKHHLMNDFDVDSIKDILQRNYYTYITDLYIESLRFFKVLLIIMERDSSLLKLNEESRKIVSETIDLITQLHFYDPFIHIFTSNGNNNIINIRSEFDIDTYGETYLKYIAVLDRSKDYMIKLINAMTKTFTESTNHVFNDEVYKRRIDNKFGFLKSKLGKLLTFYKINN